ncbi:hypothetical protein [Streptomyces sp. NPDC001621]
MLVRGPPLDLRFLTLGAASGESVRSWVDRSLAALGLVWAA